MVDFAIVKKAQILGTNSPRIASPAGIIRYCREAGKSDREVWPARNEVALA